MANVSPVSVSAASAILTTLLHQPRKASHHAYAATGTLEVVLLPWELQMDFVALLVAAVLVALSLAFIRSLERR